MWKQVSGSALCGTFCQKVPLFFAQTQDEKRGWNGPADFFSITLCTRCCWLAVSPSLWAQERGFGSTLASRSSRGLLAFSALVTRLGLLSLLHGGGSHMVHLFNSGTGQLPGQLTRGLWKQKNKEVWDSIGREHRCPSALALRKHSQPDCCSSNQRCSCVLLKWHRAIMLQTFNLASSEKEIVNQATIIYSMIAVYDASGGEHFSVGRK